MTSASLLRPKMGNFGVPGMRKWAALLTDPRDRKGWAALFGGDPERALRWTRFWLTGPGTGGAACRPQFAAFLSEAAGVLGIPALAELADGYRDLASTWAAVGRIDGLDDLSTAVTAIAAGEEELAGRLDRLAGPRPP